MILAVLVAAASASALPAEIFNFETADQQHAQQGRAGDAVRGTYSHTDDNGVSHSVTYVADDAGYRVIGRSSSFIAASPIAAEERTAAPTPVPAPAPAAAPTPAAAAPVRPLFYVLPAAPTQLRFVVVPAPNRNVFYVAGRVQP